MIAIKARSYNRPQSEARVPSASIRPQTEACAVAGQIGHNGVGCVPQPTHDRAPARKEEERKRRYGLCTFSPWIGRSRIGHHTRTLPVRQIQQQPAATDPAGWRGALPIAGRQWRELLAGSASLSQSRDSEAILRLHHRRSLRHDRAARCRSGQGSPGSSVRLPAARGSMGPRRRA